jgi:hypothetical protein
MLILNDLTEMKGAGGQMNRSITEPGAVATGSSRSDIQQTNNRNCLTSRAFADDPVATAPGSVFEEPPRLTQPPQL